MKEKLQEYALIAEIISAIAIVCSLIFVGLQIQQNSNAALAQTRSVITTQSSESIAFGMAPENLSMMEKIITGEKLSTIEELRYDLYIRKLFREAENIFYQYRIGTFDEGEFSGNKIFWENLITNNPDFMEWWEENHEEFGLIFQNDINKLIEGN